MEKKELFKKPFFILIVLLIVYIIFKLIILFSSPDIFVPEECDAATISHALATGLKEHSLFYYQYYLEPYYGGLLFDGFIGTPFILLFGPIFLSLKLACMFMSTLIFIIFFLISNKFYDKKTAVIVSSLFIFSPYFFSISIIAQGGPHLSSTLLYTIIAFLFLHNFFYKEKTIKIALLGLTCGLALYANYTSIAIILTCFIFWTIFDKLFFLRKQFIVFLLFFLIGFSPFILFNLNYSFSSIDPENKAIHSATNIFNENITSFITKGAIKFSKFMIQDLPNSFYFMYKDRPFKELNYVYYLLFIISFLTLLYSNKKNICYFLNRLVSFQKNRLPFNKQPIEIFFIVYILVFITLYSFTDFIIEPLRGIDGYRYLIPIFPSIFITIGIFLSKILKSNNNFLKKVSFLILSLILISIIISQTIYGVQMDNYNNLKKPSSCYSHLYRKVGEKHATQINENGTVKECERIQNDINKISCYDGVGYTLANNLIEIENKTGCNLLKDKARMRCHLELVRVIIGQYIGEFFCDNQSLIEEHCNKLGIKFDIQLCISRAEQYANIWKRLNGTTQIFEIEKGRREGQVMKFLRNETLLKIYSNKFDKSYIDYTLSEYFFEHPDLKEKFFSEYPNLKKKLSVNDYDDLTKIKDYTVPTYAPIYSNINCKNCDINISWGSINKNEPVFEVLYNIPAYKKNFRFYIHKLFEYMLNIPVKFGWVMLKEELRGANWTNYNSVGLHIKSLYGNPKIQFVFKEEDGDEWFYFINSIPENELVELNMPFNDFIQPKWASKGNRKKELEEIKEIRITITSFDKADQGEILFFLSDEKEILFLKSLPVCSELSTDYTKRIAKTINCILTEAS